jgi:hypothetical protein
MALKVIATLLGAVVIAIVLLWVGVALSQQEPAREYYGHRVGHDDYRKWSSQKTGNCCNERDCRPLRAEEWRETNGGVEVKIDNEWCPVSQEHFIITGKSPDGTAPHACIRSRNFVDAYNNATNCRRLLCFVGEIKS